MKARIASVVLGAGFTAATILACSLRDTAYLKSGASPAGDGDVPDNIVVVDDGGGGTRTATFVVKDQVGPRLLVQDTDALYWINNEGNILAIKKDGSEPAPRVVGKADPATTYLASEEGAGPDLFYTVGTQVFRMPKSGGAGVAIATTSPNANGLAVDPTYVFAMAGESEDGTGTEIAGIYRFLHDGSGSTVLRRAEETTLIYAIAVRGAEVFWDEGDNKFYSLDKTAAADAGPKVYAATGNGTESAIGPLGFAVDEEAIYYSDSQLVRKLPRLATSTAATLIAFPESTTGVSALVVDDRWVFAIDSALGSLRRNEKTATKEAEIMLTGLAKPTALVVDGTSVYVSVEGPPGAIVKCAK